MGFNLGESISTGFNRITDIFTSGVETLTGEKEAKELAKATKKAVESGVDNSAALALEAATLEDKKKRIRTQLEEMIRLRQTAPGRQQTLLTSNLTPTPTNNQTLLTVAQNK